MRYHQYYKILDEQIIPDKERSDPLILISGKISSSGVITIPALGSLSKPHHQHLHHHLALVQPTHDGEVEMVFIK